MRGSAQTRQDQPAGEDEVAVDEQSDDEEDGEGEVYAADGRDGGFSLALDLVPERGVRADEAGSQLEELVEASADRSDGEQHHDAERNKAQDA